jgi:L-asparaginase
MASTDLSYSISSGFLHGEQARIQLQLALATGHEFESIRKLFEGSIRVAIYNEATSFYNGTIL